MLSARRVARLTKLADVMLRACLLLASAALVDRVVDLAELAGTLFALLVAVLLVRAAICFMEPATGPWRAPPLPPEPGRRSRLSAGTAPRFNRRLEAGSRS